MLFGALLYYAAAAGWRVEITAEEITMVTFFWWKRSVRRSDITGWAMKTGWRRGNRIGHVPYRRLEIYAEPGSKSNPFMIFTKPLKPLDLHTLIGQLPPKAAT